MLETGYRDKKDLIKNCSPEQKCRKMRHRPYKKIEQED